MNRLTEKDSQGNWGLKCIQWKQLYDGQVITAEIREKLYGALWKLMEYEDTGLECCGNMMFMRQEILEKDGTKGNEKGICCRFRRDAV